MRRLNRLHLLVVGYRGLLVGWYELVERMLAIEARLNALERACQRPPGAIGRHASGGYTADSWQNDGWVRMYTDAMAEAPGYVYGPGYPGDEGEFSGADEINDTGLTNRATDDLLRQQYQTDAEELRRARQYTRERRR